MYGLQHRGVAFTEQQAIKGPKLTSVKQYKQENKRSNTCIYEKLKKRNTYKKTPTSATTEQDMFVEKAAVLNVLTSAKIHHNRDRGLA